MLAWIPWLAFGVIGQLGASWPYHLTALPFVGYAVAWESIQRSPKGGIHVACREPGRSCPGRGKGDDMMARTTLRLIILSSVVVAGASLPAMQRLRAEPSSAVAATTLDRK